MENAVHKALLIRSAVFEVFLSLFCKFLDCNFRLCWCLFFFRVFMIGFLGSGFCIRDLRNESASS
jgi:hypothetical protein